MDLFRLEREERDLILACCSAHTKMKCLYIAYLSIFAIPCPTELPWMRSFAPVCRNMSSIEINAMPIVGHVNIYNIVEMSGVVELTDGRHGFSCHFLFVVSTSLVELIREPLSNNLVTFSAQIVQSHTNSSDPVEQPAEIWIDDVVCLSRNIGDRGQNMWIGVASRVREDDEPEQEQNSRNHVVCSIVLSFDEILSSSVPHRCVGSPNWASY